MIIPLNGAEPDLPQCLGKIRAAGDIPLVGDRRWSTSDWDAITAKARSAQVPEATAWATLTSGSSGAPRIVLRSAASWADSFAAASEFLDAGPETQVALPVPPASSLTLFSLAHALSGGPKPLLGSTVNADALHGTPQSLRAMLDAGVSPRLRTALIGGSHLDPALRQRAEAAGIRVTAYYGAAELSFVACDTGDGLRAFPGAELEIRDGELWVRSPFIASGYAGATGPLRRDGDWATVGDRAELNDGYLRLLGRADDAILSASATIVPEEVEAALRLIPGVRDALVFGFPRERIGSLVSALLELEDDVQATVPDISHAQLLPAHRPRRWFSGKIPRTASGKPARVEALRLVLGGEVQPLGR
ncbi:o-succinylbenzoate--CoA ligase [Arthrobacter sp. 7749]|nr:o-succinylbenzoate--CoA ligase [Arthrobacter sp. 7749]